MASNILEAIPPCITVHLDATKKDKHRYNVTQTYKRTNLSKVAYGDVVTCMCLCMCLYKNNIKFLEHGFKYRMISIYICKNILGFGILDMILTVQYRHIGVDIANMSDIADINGQY